VSSEGEEGGPEVIVLPKNEITKAEKEPATEEKPEPEEDLENDDLEDFE